jgi:hypothetical protein
MRTGSVFNAKRLLITLVGTWLLAATAQAQPFADPTRPPNAAEAPAHPEPAAPPAALALGSIIYGPERRLAHIGGAWVREGERIGGAQVVRIGPDSVQLRRDGRLESLSLAHTRMQKKPATRANSEGR